MKQTDSIRKSIESIISLKDSEWDIILNAMQIKTLSKNEYLLKEGQICDFIAYINSGLLIYLKVADDATEVTTDFAFEGDWVTDNYSRLNNSPSFLHIKAIEDTELLIVKHKDLTDIYKKVPKLERFGRILMEQAFVKITQHSIDLQVLPAKERYLKLLQSQPQAFQKIPLYHIAHYLGIAPKSLSRIRNTIFNKD